MEGIHKRRKWQYLTNLICVTLVTGFPGGSVLKNLPASEGEGGLIPELGRSPEKEMATHSSIPAWKTPWTEEPGGQQSMGLHRVRHDCNDLAHTHA